LVVRLLPATDRDAIVGDLLEEGWWRGLRGVRLTWWVALHGAGIAAGLTAERAHAAMSLTMVREVASGVAVEGERMLRGTALRTLATRAILFAAGVLLLTLSAQLLVGALLTASNVH
jgi:hypothetical protein